MKKTAVNQEVVAALELWQQIAALRYSMGRNCSVELMIEVKDGRVRVHVVGCSLRVYDKSEWAHEDGGKSDDTRKPDYTG